VVCVTQPNTETRSLCANQPQPRRHPDGAYAVATAIAAPAPH